MTYNKLSYINLAMKKVRLKLHDKGRKLEDLNKDDVEYLLVWLDKFIEDYEQTSPTSDSSKGFPLPNDLVLINDVYLAILPLDIYGVKIWVDENNILHRDNGPAKIDPLYGTQIYYKHGIIHREDGSAVIHNDGYVHWYNNGFPI